MFHRSTAKIIVFFQNFLNELTLQCWQMVGKVVDNLTLMFKEFCLDAIDKGIAT
jgi:hypothetical protein